MAPPKLPAIHGRLDDFYGFFPHFSYDIGMVLLYNSLHFHEVDFYDNRHYLTSKAHEAPNSSGRVQLLEGWIGMVFQQTSQFKPILFQYGATIT